MTTVERSGQRIRVLFEGAGAITVPAVWQIKFLNQAFGAVTFSQSVASIVILQNQRVHLEALQVAPGKPYYYTLTITTARLTLSEAFRQTMVDQHA